MNIRMNGAAIKVILMFVQDNLMCVYSLTMIETCSSLHYFNVM